MKCKSEGSSIQITGLQATLTPTTMHKVQHYSSNIIVADNIVINMANPKII